MPPPPPSDKQSLEALPVVGIGGSAGSLEPLLSLLANMPVDTGAAYVIVTHHPSGQRSLLPEILGPKTDLPVQMVVQGEALVADRVYVALPEHDWVLWRGQLIHSRKTPDDGTGEADGADGADGAEDTPAIKHQRAGTLHPIDAFFRSLAQAAGSRALAILLSGTGSDGSLGIQAIKAQLGMVMVQDPACAEFGAMPANAIATGQADHVLAPADMPAALVGYLRSQGHRQAGQASRQSAIAPGVLSLILNLVKHRTGNDLSGYKTSSLNRRLERRMDLRQMSDPEAYLAYLKSHPEEVNLLFQEFLISVTGFFRDRATWDKLADGLLADMLRESARTGEEFRAWVVGCATGEEAYTLAVLIQECLVDWEQAPTVKIFATDVDLAAIETARRGRYPVGIARDLKESHLHRYFSPENDSYQIHQQVRDMVVFAEHNALQDPPFTNLNLISCRNLLIYLERDHQERLMALFRYALRDHGLLILGTAESPDHQSDAFSIVSQDCRIYRVAEASSPSRLPLMPGVSRQRRSSPQQSTTVGDDERLARAVEHLLAQQFAPPAVVVNDRGEVVYIHGRTGHFLEPARGPARNQLLEMARPGLRDPLSQALLEMNAGESDHFSQLIQVQNNGAAEPLRLEVQRIRSPNTLAGLQLVVLHPDPASETRKRSGGSLHDASVAKQADDSAETGVERRLQRELEALRQEKQLALKEMQIINEALQSVNEALQSTNEEYQSSNEELEVAKEEVESLNQELRSVNAEQLHRMDDLGDINDDLKNLLDSAHLATLFLDESLNIKRFTNSVQDLIAVRPADIGRPLGDLTTRLRYDALVADAETVLNELTPRELKVQAENGHWYLLHIQPYRSTRNVVRGVICTFQDIQASRSVTHGETFFRTVLDTVHEPLLVLDPDWRVVSANDGFYRRFPLTPEAVEGKSLFDLADGQWDHPELRIRLAEVLPQQQAFCDFELQLNFGDSGPVCLRLNGRRLELGDGAVMILLAMDVQ